MDPVTLIIAIGLGFIGAKKVAAIKRPANTHSCNAVATTVENHNHYNTWTRGPLAGLGAHNSHDGLKRYPPPSYRDLAAAVAGNHPVRIWLNLDHDITKFFWEVKHSHTVDLSKEQVSQLAAGSGLLVQTSDPTIWPGEPYDPDIFDRHTHLVLIMCRRNPSPGDEKHEDATMISGWRTYGNGAVDPSVAMDIMDGRGANMLYVSPDCQTIIEGPYFEPISSGLDLNAESFDNLNDTLSRSVYGDRNSVYGYIDYLMSKGENHPLDIAETILREAFNRNSPLKYPCGPGVGVGTEFIQSFASRIAQYVEENGGIIWSPG